MHCQRRTNTPPPKLKSNIHPLRSDWFFLSVCMLFLFLCLFVVFFSVCVVCCVVLPSREDVTQSGWGKLVFVKVLHPAKGNEKSCVGLIARCFAKVAGPNHRILQIAFLPARVSHPLFPKGWCSALNNKTEKTKKCQIGFPQWCFTFCFGVLDSLNV
jgi:hypothetical protein